MSARRFCVVFVKGDQLYVSMFRWTYPEDLLPARFNPPDPRVSSYGGVA